MSYSRLSTLAGAILLSAAAAAHAGDLPQPYGAAAPAPAAQRDINIGPATRYVNVERAETVRFVTQEGAFAWNFDIAPNRHVFDLALIAPPTLKTEGIRVFVAEPPGDR